MDQGIDGEFINEWVGAYNNLGISECGDNITEIRNESFNFSVYISLSYPFLVGWIQARTIIVRVIITFSQYLDFMLAAINISDE